MLEHRNYSNIPLLGVSHDYGVPGYLAYTPELYPSIIVGEGRDQNKVNLMLAPELASGCPSLTRQSSSPPSVSCSQLQLFPSWGQGGGGGTGLKLKIFFRS